MVRSRCLVAIRSPASRASSNPLSASINADVIPSRFRAEMTAFWKEKEMTIFFVSIAHHFSERASQVVSRGSVAALIPHEKSATLTQPLKENTHKSARNYTGADMEEELDPFYPISAHVLCILSRFAILRYE